MFSLTNILLKKPMQTVLIIQRLPVGELSLIQSWLERLNFTLLFTNEQFMITKTFVLVCNFVLYKNKSDFILRLLECWLVYWYCFDLILCTHYVRHSWIFWLCCAPDKSNFNGGSRGYTPFQTQWHCSPRPPIVSPHNTGLSRLSLSCLTGLGVELHLVCIFCYCERHCHHHYHRCWLLNVWQKSVHHHDHLKTKANVWEKI